MSGESGENRTNDPSVHSREAERAVDHLCKLLPDLRGCAVLDGGGRLLAASGPSDTWQRAASAFLDAADAAAPEREPFGSGDRATQVHVGIEAGETFAVRHRGLAMVAVSERFTLASLVLFDMRTILGDLAAGEIVDRRAPTIPAAAGQSAEAA